MSNQDGRRGHGCLLGDNIRGPGPERSAERDAQEDNCGVVGKPETIRKGPWGDQSRSPRSRLLDVTPESVLRHDFPDSRYLSGLPDIALHYGTLRENH